jgi:hypothetical protein
MLLPSKSAIDFIIILVAVVNDGKMGAFFDFGGLRNPFGGIINNLINIHMS